MEQYFLDYAALQQQRWMVSDNHRTDAFAQAITEAVKPGDLVIDVGAGTGLLSILAAKAGARQVVGVEKSNMAIHAKELIEHNGLTGRVEIFHGDAKDLQLNEKADLIVSEWIGHMGFVEAMFNSVMKVRDAWLKPGGKMLPSSIDIMLAPIDDNELFYKYGPGYWQSQLVHGIDFSKFTAQELEMGHSSQIRLYDKHVLADAKSINHMDTVSAKPGAEKSVGSVEFVIQKDGEINGFAGYFSTQLSPNVVLDTSPASPHTHWSQTYLPFFPTKVKEGDKVNVNFDMDEAFNGSRQMKLNLRIEDKEIQYVLD